MGILGITNRTENFKTAKTFAPFLGNDAESRDRRLRLARKLGSPVDTQAENAEIELFWKGIRDHLDQQRSPKRDPLLSDPTVKDLAHRYTQLHRSLGGLREKIETFQSEDGLTFERLNSWNYCERPFPHEPEEGIDCRKKLAESLLNTEIDIVLETKNRLYIGEAKDVSDFHASSGLVLVHQLIRQYVMAKVLLDIKGLEKTKTVLPFIVCGGDKRPLILKKLQTQFMKKHFGLIDENILTWEQIDEIAGV